MNIAFLLTLFFFLFPKSIPLQEVNVELVILGNVQDGGSPHIGCEKECCAALFDKPDPLRKVVSLGLIDKADNRTYLFEATPDISSQIKKLNVFSGNSEENKMPDGIFLTHAHLGHYTGLAFLGREAKGAKNIPVYAMPRFNDFLTNNGPWSQLVTLKNIQLKELTADNEVHLSANIKITPILVPHRDEYSETVGYVISGSNKKALFIPDIDKWKKWELDVVKEVSKVDYAFLDATFYDASEVNYRDINEIPHPFVIETMDLFRDQPEEIKKKIYFIHFNHTNPLLNEGSSASDEVLKQGFNIARFGMKFQL